MLMFFLCLQKVVSQTPQQQFWILNQSSKTSDTLVWDVGPFNNQIDNGSATLLASSILWTSNKGKTDSKWAACKNAVFGGKNTVGAAGTVTLSVPMNSIKSISFYPAANGNFSIAGQSIQSTCKDTLSVFVADSLTPSISSVFTGTNILDKKGKGTLILSGNNTYTGNTLINKGVLQLGNGTAGSLATTSTINIANGSALYWNVVKGSQVLSNPIMGAGSLIVQVAGNMSYSGGGDGTKSTITNINNSFSGGTTLLGGYIFANTANLGTGTITMKGGGLYFSGNVNWTTNPIEVATGSSGYIRSSGGTVTIDVPISGDGTLNLTDNSSTVFKGNNSFDGNIVMGNSSNNFSISGTSVLGSGTYSGTITNQYGCTFNWNSSSPQIFNGPINSTNGHFWFNAGNTTLNGGANITGAIAYPTSGDIYLNLTNNSIITQNITAGIYNIANYYMFQNNASNSRAILNMSGGTITIPGTLDLGHSTSGGSSNNLNTINMTGGSINVTGTFQLYKWATNYVNITNSTLKTNILYLGWVDSVPTAYFNVNEGGVFEFKSLTIKPYRNYFINLNGGILKPTDIPAATFVSFSVQSGGGTIDNKDTDILIGQIITGSGELIFSGAGATTLSGNNTYSGNTIVNAGTLTAGHVNAFGSGQITVNAGATLKKNGFIISNAIVNNGGTVMP